MSKPPFYISTAIPYVNAAPHIGHALEFIQADCMARYKRLLGHDVYFLTGTDENSLKNVQAAEKAGIATADFVKQNARYFQGFKELLKIDFTDFIRTTEKRHFAGAEALWKRCKPDDIYRKKYKGLYCVGCETFYSPADLVNGKCPEHLIEPDEIEEENYFFKLTNYQQKLISILESGEVEIIPSNRANETLQFIRTGLQDFSISRSCARAHGWGVPVPGDSSQIMYVWFDALANYITALDFATSGENFERYWTQPAAEKRQVLHVIGKGISRFHAVYWLAMLLSAEVPLPTAEFIHGYLTVDGQKMSKSLGNIYSPEQIVDLIGIDGTRYYLLAAVSAYQDGDFSLEKCKEFYNAHLANGLGNLNSRVIGMLEKYCDFVIPPKAADPFDTGAIWKAYHRSMERFEFHEALKTVNLLSLACDRYVMEQKPWAKVKAGESVCDTLYQLLEALRHIALALLPVIPTSATRILDGLHYESRELNELTTSWGRLKPGEKLSKPEPLFIRL